MSIQVLGTLDRGLVDPDTPVAAADDLGITRGDGCFEGLRLRRMPDGGAEIDFLDRHLARMGRSAGALGIPFAPGAWSELAALLTEAWAEGVGGVEVGEEEAAVKLVLTRGRPGGETPTGYGYVFPVGGDAVERRRDGVDVATLARGYSATSFADAPWLLGGAKLLSYALNMSGQREARRRGAHEPLWVTEDGMLLEAAVSSVVWASGRRLRTVADGEGNGILHSITTEVVVEGAAGAGWDTSYGSGTVADLVGADLVALVGSVMGPVAVRSIDGTALPRTEAGAALLADMRRWAHFGA